MIDPLTKIGFTGTRHGMTLFQLATFIRILSRLKPDRFLHGDCVGSDAQAHNEAIKLGIGVEIHPPNIDAKRAYCTKALVVHTPKPYLLRNNAIVDDCGLLIATPLGPEVARSGTWYTIHRAQLMLRPYIIIWPDGVWRR